MRPLLFYLRGTDAAKNDSHQKFLEILFGVGVDTYPVLDHIESEYDHDNPPPELPGTCWCTIPDQNDPIWPKLFFNPERKDTWHGDSRFVAKGNDIFQLDLKEIHSKFGDNISGPGDWEIN